MDPSEDSKAASKDDADNNSSDDQPLLPSNDIVEDTQRLQMSDQPNDGTNTSSSGNDDPTNGQPADSVPWYRRKMTWGAAIGTAVGATAAVVAAPIVIGAMGFGVGGIAAGSYAASMMSAAAAANGGGVAAGSLVAILQSIGAAGFSAAGLVGVGAAGGAAGAAIGTGAGAVADVVQSNGGANDEADGGESEKKDAASNKDENNEGKTKAGDKDIELKTMEQRPSPQSSDSTTGSVEISITDTTGNSRPFTVGWNEQLYRVLMEYVDMIGRVQGSVQFEFNGVQLNGSETLNKIGFKVGDIIKAIIISHSLHANQGN